MMYGQITCKSMAKQSTGVLFEVGFLLLLSMNTVWCKESRDMLKDKDSLVEVRAVFINCIPDERQDNPENELLRFERQELFRHNALHGCNKKLALTVKMVTEPASDKAMNNENPSAPPSQDDEYIPIDHVFEGLVKKRVRLLNPYILRLRREVPRQVYKLRRLDTVTGILTSTEPFGNFLKVKKQKNRERREIENAESDDFPIMLNSGGPISLDHNDPLKQSFSIHVNHLPERQVPIMYHHLPQFSTKSTENDLFNLFSNASLSRNKRHIQIIDENPTKFRSFRDPQHLRGSDGRKLRTTQDFQRDRYDIEDIEQLNNELRPVEVTPVIRHNKQDAHRVISEVVSSTAWTESPEADVMEREALRTEPVDVTKSSDYDAKNEFLEENYKKKGVVTKDFALYEIGDPDLRYDIKLQLFEKTSTPDGKTVWYDLNNGEQASINSSSPEWRSKDMNVRYKPTEWIPREDFILPATKLCLLEPLKERNYSVDDDDFSTSDNSNLEYIVVPAEDIIYLSDKPPVKKQQGNETDDDRMISQDGSNEEGHNRVEVRVSRAITSGIKHNFGITLMGNEQFLTLPHRRPHSAQVDLEVKADDNQLVRVGSSGRLATIVADSSRRIRSTIHVQATNTGLASAKFKVIARECGPELDSLLNERSTNQISVGPILLPPQHTQRVRLEVPMEVPVDVTKCNVALVNEDEESVAVREVRIKKGDRCFCVWQCDCVCLGEDPKLICRDMSQSQQVAAGLSTCDRPRYARQVVEYTDVCIYDLAGLVCGIIAVLLVFGSFKAVLGLQSPTIGTFGFDHILKSPRKLNSYYEDELCGIPVVYDESGWPVHPETSQKTVRVVDKQTEFLLNLIFFIAIIAITLNAGLKKLVKRFWNCASRAKCRAFGANVYSAHDLQGESMELVLRRKVRRHALRRRWMSPQAEELTDHFLRDNTDIRCSCDDAVYESHRPCDDKCYINQETRPLLLETKLGVKSDCLSVGDSEQEDTDYVLMQMQKSRESLARSQRKHDDSAHSAEKVLNIKSAHSNSNMTTKK